MNSEFDIFLNNSQDFHLFDDENSYFHAVLPTPLYFPANKFAVALTEFSYDSGKLIVLEYSEFKVFYKDPSKNKRVKLEDLHFSDLDDLRFILKQEAGITFEYTTLGKLQIILDSDVTKVEFYYDKLRRILGFHNSVLKNFDVADLMPNLYANVENIYVKCDFCDVRMVSSLFLPVLRELPNRYKKKGNDVICERFDTLSYVDVVVQELHSVKISLVNQSGNLVKFIKGANFSCTLRFKSV